jgi:type II secretory pathway pseudopilin PulG
MVRRRSQGFTYLTVLFMLAILMGGLALVGEMWGTSTKREKETELLFVGHQYRRAIALYYDSTPGGVKRYPRQLEDLIKDPRQPSTQRHLRKLYPDPVTGKDWALVKAPDGGILGVHSVSEEAPLKIAGFKLRDAGFESAQKYSDWQFVHTLPAQAAPGKPAPKPGAQPAQQVAPQPLTGPAPAAGPTP